MTHFVTPPNPNSLFKNHFFSKSTTRRCRINQNESELNSFSNQQKRSMMNTRNNHIPKSPSTIEEVSAGLEARIYPALSQDMYAGSMHIDIKCESY